MTDKPTNNETDEPEFPREITFKVVFYNKDHVTDSVKGCLAENDLNYQISDKISANSKFISFTISADFATLDLLNKVCSELKSLTGYKMMF